MIYRYSIDTFLGKIYFVSNENMLLCISFIDPIDNPLVTVKETANKPIKDAIKWLNLYLDHKNPPPLSLKITHLKEFLRNTLELVKEIPYGETITYKDLGQRYQERYKVKSMSLQALGTTLGNNLYAILIPCHRVIGSNNRLGGYAFGIEKKLALLEHEGIDTSKLKYEKE